MAARVIELNPTDRECTRLFAAAMIAAFKDKVGADKLEETLIAYIERLSESALKALTAADVTAADVATTIVDSLGTDNAAKVHAALAQDPQGARAIISWIDQYLPRLRYGVEKALGGGVPPLKKVS